MVTNPYQIIHTIHKLEDLISYLISSSHILFSHYFMTSSCYYVGNFCADCISHRWKFLQAVNGPYTQLWEHYQIIANHLFIALSWENFVLHEFCRSYKLYPNILPEFEHLPVNVLSRANLNRDLLLKQYLDYFYLQ